MCADAYLVDDGALRYRRKQRGAKEDAQFILLISTIARKHVDEAGDNYRHPTQPAPGNGPDGAPARPSEQRGDGVGEGVALQQPHRPDPIARPIVGIAESDECGDAKEGDEERDRGVLGYS